MDPVSDIMSGGRPPRGARNDDFAAAILAVNRAIDSPVHLWYYDSNPKLTPRQQDQQVFRLFC